MKIIKVSEIIPNAFSSDQAIKLRDEMKKHLNNKENILLDFSGIDKYTTLFFNFCTGFFIRELGKEKYDELVRLDNLSNLGQSTYQNSYNNAIRDDYDSPTIEDEINNILKNIEDN